MRIGLVVDSSCDLPQDFREQHDIRVLPITIRIGQDHLLDQQDPQAALEFYRSELGARGADAESMPFAADQIAELFLEQLIGDFDYVFCQTVSRTRSSVFQNATKASFTILSEYRDYLSGAARSSPFAMRVLNTGTFFSGQGVIAAETVRMIEAGCSPTEIRERLDLLVASVRAYAIPQDVYYLRARARAKGDRSMGLLSAMMASTLDIKPIICGQQDHTEVVARVRGFDNAAERVLKQLRQQVEQGLDAPFVGLSYAGELACMRLLPGYEELAQACESYEVTLLESVMNVTGGVNLGPGTLSAAILAKSHEFQ